jgi:hypothetical protein
MGDCLHRAVFFAKLTELAHIFGLLFPQLRLSIKIDKKWVGPHFGRFFTNSSGHPA